MSGRDDFIQVVRTRWTLNRNKIEAQARHDRLFMDTPDWPWTGFIVCFATNGGVSHYEKNVQPRMANYLWPQVSSMTLTQRRILAEKIVNPRRRTLLIPAFEACFQRFLKAGGPAGIRAEYHSFDTPRKLIRYLKSYDGIGDKCARNLPMDVCDKRMVDHFALDSRLKEVLGAVLNPMPGYRQAEEWLRGVAREVGIDAWSLDRLIFSDKRAFMRELKRFGNTNETISDCVTSIDENILDKVDCRFPCG